MNHAPGLDEGNDCELLVAAGPDSLRIIPVTGRRQTVGRSPSCGLRIDDPALEPHHALIVGVDRPDERTNPDDLVAAIRPLGGVVESRGSTFRVGSSVCWVRPAITPSLIDRPSGTSKPFHRPPQASIENMTPPVQPRVADRPTMASSPPWNAIIGGVATGLIVAGVTGQWLFGIFSLVTAGIAAVTWVIQRRGCRRAVRRWDAAVNRDRELFDRQCRDYAHHLADRRRERHQYLGALMLAVITGDRVMWSKRRIDDVCIGFGSRQVEVVPGARPLVFNDIPVTVNVSPGRIIGIHGPRAVAVGTALVLRLAMEIGPADWRLLTAEDPSIDERSHGWNHLRGLVHRRTKPLTREDLEIGGDESRHDVILVVDPAQVAHRQATPLRYLESHRASMIVCAPTQRELPAVCTDIVDSMNHELDGVSPESARHVVNSLALWHDPDERSLSLPHRVRLADVGAIDYLDSESLSRLWMSASSRITLGMTADGPIGFDLASDGPHMVVVGTTGSGKSEFLRSLVASTCLQMSPADVNFVLFDYKGGAAFDICGQLPHVVGVVTDLDRDEVHGSMATRALSGLEAELRRRESVLRHSSCSSQMEYQSQRMPSDAPMPRLVIVVDELAALRADVPEAVPALVAIAQRGRSLGLQLVVATQRPGTELTPDVMANAAVRVALRLQTREDSLQVVGDAAAASLPHGSPGRAIVVFGSSRPEEFQSLMVTDDLPALVATARTLAEDLQLPQPRRPWCAPLPARLFPEAGRDRFTIGVIDDPRRQQQMPLRWDPSQHLLVTAGPNAGKTWLLHTLAAISGVDDPDARLFFLSGRGDRDRQSMWIAASDRERLQRALVHVGGIIESRRSSGEFGERITVMIDDVDLWRSQHADDRIGAMQWELFERIVVEGPAVGVTGVFTASHGSSLPTVLRTRFEQQWSGGHRPGSFVIGGSDPSGAVAQVYDPRAFSEDLDRLLTMTDADRHAVLVSLPGDVSASVRCRPGSFGIRADTLGEAVLRSDRALRLLIVGARASGRTTALTAVVEAWKDLHPDGSVIDDGRLDDDESIHAAIERAQTRGPILIAVDDADRRRMSPIATATLQKVLSDHGLAFGVSSDALSIVSTASPQGVRSQPDHWLHLLRRHRCGVLLGRCAGEDGDLLGHYSRHLEVVPRAVSRGVWIDDGESSGVVQFYRHGS